MDQSEADWGDWSINNDEGVGQLETDEKQDDVDDEQRLTAYDEDPQKGPADFRMYDDEAGIMSASGGSDISDIDDLDDTSELAKELAERPGRGPLGQLQPQGMVMCEFCGRLGVRDAFYSKTKRFCTVSCSKNFADSQRDGKPTPFTMLQASMTQNKQKIKQGNLKSQYIVHGGVKFGSGSARAFDWSSYLNQIHATAAPVSCFKHCIMSDSWDNIAVGMKVEIPNTDCETDAYWIATVIQLAGYRAQMRYEGFGNDSSLDFWRNLCCKDVHPVGWCAANSKPLVPPNTIIHKYLDWKDFLVKRLTGARTLPQNFYTKVQDCLKNTPIKKGMFVEVVDKMCVSAMRVARVEHVIGGRLKLHYVDSKIENDEFWCHQESPLVHPVGWSQIVGHKIHASNEYKHESLVKYTKKQFAENDSKPEMFKKNKDPPSGGKFQVGVKLEAIDPLNLSSICVATVAKVLRNNYLMIAIDGSSDNGADWFCYHSSSPCIFPVGFCEINNLDITPPRNHKGSFKWFDYMKDSKSTAAPVKLFDKTIPRHGFRSGMKIEAVDLMEPRLICVATVKNVVGRLLRVHFDGWEDTYDQWIDCHSADIYPVGWCEMVGYHLEGPRSRAEPSQQRVNSVPRKRKSKSQMYRGPRKKRKAKPLTPVPGKEASGQDPVDCSDISQDGYNLNLSDSQPKTTDDQSKAEEISKASQVEGGTNPDSQLCDVNEAASADGTPVESGKQSTADGSSSPSKPDSQLPSKSALASSMPSITNILNSPVSKQQQQQQHSQVKDKSLTLSPARPSVEIVSPSTSPRQPHVFTVQNVHGQSAVFTLSSPSSSPGKQSRQIAHVFTHNIPRVLPEEPESDCAPPVVINSSQVVEPDKWGVIDVCQFLRVNDCGSYCDSFRKEDIDGPKFLNLAKEQLVNLTGMKVGPSLKIYDLIQLLKAKVGEQRSVDTKDNSSTTTVTASLLLKQQGLIQQTSIEQQDLTSADSRSRTGEIRSPQLLNNTAASVAHHSRAFTAQLTQ